MISFRKFVMVGAMLAAFAGLAAAQTVTVLGIQPEAYPTLRQEGLTEALPALDFTLTATGATPVGGSVVNYDLTILANGGAPFTSPAATIMTTSAAGTISVSGPIVRIPNVTFTFGTLLTPSATATVTISGLRIDANALGANSFASIQATAFPTNGLTTQNGVGLTAISSGNVNAAVVQTSLKTTLSASSDSPIKDSTTSGSWTSTNTDGSAFDPTNTDPTVLANPLFTAKFTALYAGAFWYTAPAESKLRFTFTVTNLPAGLALYVPQAAGALSLVLGTDASGANGYLAPATLAAYPVAANGMVTYELEMPSGVTPAYSIPVYSVGTTPLALTSTAAPVTFNGGYAPLSTDLSAKATSPVLRFASSSVTEYDSWLIVILPSSNLIFPYVASGSGWTTGIAIVNGGSGWGSAKDVAKGAAGACTLTFFSADGVAAAPAAVKTGAVVPGGYTAFTVDSLNIGAYNGVVFATCNFDNAKGFTYINGDGTTAGYLAVRR